LFHLQQGLIELRINIGMECPILQDPFTPALGEIMGS
jgi:hypothetical protein